MGTMPPKVVPGATGSLPMQTLQPYGALMAGSMLPMPAPTPPTMTLDDHGSGCGLQLLSRLYLGSGSGLPLCGFALMTSLLRYLAGPAAQTELLCAGLFRHTTLCSDLRSSCLTAAALLHTHNTSITRRPNC